MLQKIRLINFKSAKDLEIRLSPLTVLTGLNGSGKSTVLQSIALLKQTLNVGDTRLLLQGPLIGLGRSEDVQFEGAETDRIELIVRSKDSASHFTATASHGADSLDMVSVGNVADLTNELNTGFQFIQADRLTPALQYDQASTIEQFNGWLGCKGEFTVDYLQRNGDKHIPIARRYVAKENENVRHLLAQTAPTPSLQDQVAGWMQQLSPGIKITATPVDIAESAALRFQYTGTSIDSLSRSHKPSHVGFGLTYCLPIVVACLSAPNDALLLLENPEAHLHPRGQAALGALLAKCAADGVQIIVETHSDHVLNGIRVAVKSQAIDANKISIHYFTRAIETGQTTLESPKILPDGQMDRWLDGFFDQWDRSLDELLE